MAWSILLVFSVLILVCTGFSRSQDQFTETSNKCDVVELPTAHINNLLQLSDNLASFMKENNQTEGYTAIENLLLELGVDLEIESGQPLLTYVMRFQNYLAFDLKQKISRNEIALSNSLDSSILKLLDLIANDVETKVVGSEMKLIQKFDAQLSQIKQFVTDSEVRMNQRLEQIDLKLDELLLVPTPPPPPPTPPPTTPIIITTTTPQPDPTDCYDIYNGGNISTGIYTIYPESYPPFDAFCDMETDGGGWTVFLNRDVNSDTPLNFDRDWQQYKDGFGDLNHEYWMGNEALHQMTNTRDYEMRTDAISTNGSPTEVWGQWNVFKVESELRKYKLTISRYDGSSSMDNSFKYNDKLYFTTKDKDNDRYGKNCASATYGGFWYKRCSYNFPTSKYSEMTFRPWSKQDSEKKVASQVQMKIRPRK